MRAKVGYYIRLSSFSRHFSRVDIVDDSEISEWYFTRNGHWVSENNLGVDDIKLESEMELA